jgi:hypothetical protein
MQQAAAVLPPLLLPGCSLQQLHNQQHRTAM